MKPLFCHFCYIYYIYYVYILFFVIFYLHISFFFCNFAADFEKIAPEAQKEDGFDCLQPRKKMLKRVERQETRVKAALWLLFLGEDNN